MASPYPGIVTSSQHPWASGAADGGPFGRSPGARAPRVRQLSVSIALRFLSTKYRQNASISGVATPSRIQPCERDARSALVKPGRLPMNCSTMMAPPYRDCEADLCGAKTFTSPDCGLYPLRLLEHARPLNSSSSSSIVGIENLQCIGA